MIRFLQSGNKAAKYILGGFLTILAVSMVAYLIPGFMSSTDTNAQQSGTLSTVAGVHIERDQVVKLAQQMAQAQARGQRADMYVPFLMPRAAQELIQREVVAYEAGRMGLMVSDQEIRDELQKGVYKDTFFPDGKFIGKDKY